MKLFGKLTKKLAGKAGTAVKTEVRKTALDLLPKVLGVLAMVGGIVIFREGMSEPKQLTSGRPSISNTTTTTNNYFFTQMSEETIRKIIEK